ncbi:MAG TPA: ABC transporter ATP-binding protein [Treponemataceae bacterium]|nr:ABC transporter ATP-binding protein [Treponemataceae bacterium]
MINAITVKNITKKYHKSSSTSKFTALDNVSFFVKKGSTTLIAGANGSGKTVLMSIIAGLVKPTIGTIKTEGRVGLIFQDSETQILGETPEEDIDFGLKNTNVPKSQRQAIIQDMMQKTGLSHRAGFPARFLSGGEKRRLAVSSMLALNCPIIIFDEPFANLDYTGVKQVNGLIAMLQREGRTIIILTHELEKCLALAERFLVLYMGVVVFDGSPQTGIKKNLEKWNIKNPLTQYSSYRDLIWL